MTIYAIATCQPACRRPRPYLVGDEYNSISYRDLRLHIIARSPALTRLAPSHLSSVQERIGNTMTEDNFCDTLGASIIFTNQVALRLPVGWSIVC